MPQQITELASLVEEVRPSPSARFGHRTPVWPDASAAQPIPVFPTRRGHRLSRGALQRCVAKHARAASQSCPTLVGNKNVPHVLRHSAAMRLHAHVATVVIARWFGHVGVATTQTYVTLNALARTTSIATVPGRYPPTETITASSTTL